MGAAGPQTLLSAAKGQYHKSLDVWLVGQGMPWTGHDPLLAAQLVSRLSCLGMVLGAMMGGWAVVGRRGAVAAGLLASVWSLSIFPALMVGADPPAYGLVWLAAGMTWMGAKLGWKGVPLLAAGCVLAGFATAIKSSALPGVVVAAMAPVVIRGRWVFLPVAGAVTYLALNWGWDTYTPKPNFIFEDIPPVTLESFRYGWFKVSELPARHMPAGSFGELTWLCLLGAFLPGPGWKQRVAMGLGSLGCLWLCARTIDIGTPAEVVPRRLIGVCFGVVVMAGVGLAMIQRNLRRWPLLSWGPLAVGVVLIFMDSWAYFHAWGQMRAECSSADPPELPVPPESWSQKYAQLTTLDFRDLCAEGSMDLVEMVEAYPNGVAIPRLRDERHNHLSAAAELAGVPWVMVGPGTCEVQEPMVVDALQKAGVMLILPTQIDGEHRMTDEGKYLRGELNCQDPSTRSEYCWYLRLKQSAQATGLVESYSPYWDVLPSSATGTGSLPCQRQEHTSKGQHQVAGTR